MKVLPKFTVCRPGSVAIRLALSIWFLAVPSYMCPLSSESILRFYE